MPIRRRPRTMTVMAENRSSDPDRTVTINAGRGPSWGFVVAVLGFVLSLVAILAIGIVSLDLTAADLDPGPAAVQEQGASDH